MILFIKNDRLADKIFFLKIDSSRDANAYFSEWIESFDFSPFLRAKDFIVEWPKFSFESIWLVDLVLSWLKQWYAAGKNECKHVTKTILHNMIGIIINSWYVFSHFKKYCHEVTLRRETLSIDTCVANDWNRRRLTMVRHVKMQCRNIHLNVKKIASWAFEKNMVWNITFLLIFFSWFKFPRDFVSVSRAQDSTS